MAQGIPSWMNAEFAQGILRRGEQDESIEVIDIEWKPATNKGDNYTSDMYRIFVNLARQKAGKRITEKKTIVMKVAPRTEGGRKELVENSSIFDVEINMMTNTLKKMNEIVGKKHRFNATIYYARREPPSTLALEDLAPLGFRMADRQSGLDLEHSLIVMRNIARFHASSAVLCEREPSHKGLYTRGIFSDQHPKEMHTFFNSGALKLAEEVEKWPELGSMYAEKIKALANDLYDRGMAAAKPRANEFNVIIHGDCWVNNMLFQYNDQGKPIGHIFVDFQMCVFTSPAIDLHYFLSTSPSPKVFEESKDALIEEYWRTLTAALKEYGYKGAVPTMDDLERYLTEREIYAVIATATILPVILVDTDKAVSIDEMIKEDGSYNNPGYAGTTYRKHMCKRLPYFLGRGLLDA